MNEVRVRVGKQFNIFILLEFILVAFRYSVRDYFETI